MCARKETDVRESPNDSTPAGGEGQGSRKETLHLIYGESPVSSVAEHPLHVGEGSSFTLSQPITDFQPLPRGLYYSFRSADTVKKRQQNSSLSGVWKRDVLVTMVSS
jgi:hypothetical protein